MLSPDLNTSVDFSVLNAFEDYFNYSSGERNNLDFITEAELGYFNFSGDLFSGDYFSGELLSRLGYRSDLMRNHYSLFLYKIYNKVLDVLRSTDLNSSVSFTLHGRTYTISSSQFEVPNNALKTFVSSSLIVMIFMVLYQTINNIYLTFATLDLRNALNSFDSPHTFFM